MVMLLVLLYLALPPILATTYAVFWPTIPSRVGLFITLGSLLGVAISVAALFWAAQPLIGIGISGGRPGQTGNTLGPLLGSRMLVGVLMEAFGVGLVLNLLARWLRST